MEHSITIKEKYPLKSNSPENLGIPSDAILRFIEHLERRQLCLHGFMIIRHDEIAAEGYYPPFGPDRLHRMYSTSKSFVSAAIGLLIDEGKIRLNDRVVTFFPEYVPREMHPFIAEMTIRDLLLMATPHLKTTYTLFDKNWVSTFFNIPPTHEGGSIFLYDTSGTVVLNAIVEKISGKELLEYMRPKLLNPIGFSEEAWCVERPEGGAWGGSGILCTTRDLAKFALLLLHKGCWKGKQLLSRAYLDEACAPLIDNRISQEKAETQFGYGYQIWQTRHNGYGTLGLGSQLSLCLPEKDLVLVTTADTQAIAHGNDIILDAFWTDVYPHLEKEALKENKIAQDRVKAKLDNLKFLPVVGAVYSPKSADFSGKTYIFPENPMGIRNVQFIFEEDQGLMRYTNVTGLHEIVFGFGKYLSGVFPETHYFGKRIGVPGLRGYDYQASGAWFNENSLMVYLYIIDDYLGTLKMNFAFKSDRLTIIMRKYAEWFLEEYEGTASGRTRIS